MLLKLKKESLTKQSELSAKVNNNVAMVISRTSDQEFEFGRDIFSHSAFLHGEFESLLCLA